MIYLSNQLTITLQAYSLISDFLSEDKHANKTLIIWKIATLNTEVRVILCALSLQDVGDHKSPLLPVK